MNDSLTGDTWGCLRAREGSQPAAGSMRWVITGLRGEGPGVPGDDRALKPYHAAAPLAPEERHAA